MPFATFLGIHLDNCLSRNRKVHITKKFLTQEMAWMNLEELWETNEPFTNRETSHFIK